MMIVETRASKRIVDVKSSSAPRIALARIESSIIALSVLSEPKSQYESKCPKKTPARF